MKHFFLTLLVILCSVLTIQAQRTYILCVGVSSYQNSNMNLAQTTKDAKAFQKVMSNYTKDITILTSKYANRANILEKLSAICNRAQKDDKILFYFSGHGYPGGIATYDQLLDYQDINNLLSKSAAGAKICFVDACHAGSVNNVKDQTKTYKAPTGNILYLMACRGDEYSMEHTWVGHGYFTQALLKGLRGKADANHDKKITVNELFNYAYNDVQHTMANSTDSQHPQMIGSKALTGTVLIDWNK